MFGLLGRLLVLLGGLWLGVPLAMEAADAPAVDLGVPKENILKLGAGAFGLYLLANRRLGSGRGGRRRGRR